VSKENRNEVGKGAASVSNPLEKIVMHFKGGMA